MLGFFVELEQLDLGTALPPENSPLEYLACVIINGVNKSAAYEIGKPVDVKRMAAQWNAVYIQDQWMLVDTYWSSVCITGRQTGDWTLLDVDGKMVNTEENDEQDVATQHTVNEFYFLTDPDKFIMTHFPVDPEWQLLNNTWSLKEFESYVYIREMFWDIGVKLSQKSKKKCHLEAYKGALDLEFSVPSSHNLKFKYMLYMCGREAITKSMDLFVFYQKSKEEMKYSIEFPIKGIFKFDIFGYDSTRHDTLDLVCSYRIDCSKPNTDCEPLPDNPVIGWGPGEEASHIGLKAKTHEGGLIMANYKGEVEIRFNITKQNLDLSQYILTNEKGAQVILENYVITRIENDEAILTVRLPKPGQYALKVHAINNDSYGSLSNVCNYLIKCNNEKLKNHAYPAINNGIIGQTSLCDSAHVVPISFASSALITTKKTSENFQFRSEEGCTMWCNVDNIEMDSNELDLLVKRTNTKEDNCTTWSFDIDLPQKGEYAVNFYLEQKSEIGRLYNVVNYLIVSGPESKRKTQLSEDRTDNENSVVATKSSTCIKLPPGIQQTTAVGVQVKRPKCKDPIGYGGLQILNTELVEVKLPQDGLYIVDSFRKNESGSIRRIAKHKISCQISTETFDSTLDITADDIVPEAINQEGTERQIKEIQEKNKTEQAEKEQIRKRKQLYQRLEKSLKSDDVNDIQGALEEFENNQVPDKDNIIDDARKTIIALKMRNELTQSMNSRDLEAIDNAIKKAEEENHRHKLDLQLAMAKRIQENLKRIERLRHAIMDLDQRTIAEIKSYGTPPPIVKEVMYATFLLLGNVDEDMGDWKAIQVLIGKTGKEGLKRRVMQFKVEMLDIEIALKSKRLLGKYSLDEVRDVSAGIAAFYVWASAWLGTGVCKQLVVGQYG